MTKVCPANGNTQKDYLRINPWKADHPKEIQLVLRSSGRVNSV